MGDDCGEESMSDIEQAIDHGAERSGKGTVMLEREQEDRPKKSGEVKDPMGNSCEIPPLEPAIEKRTKEKFLDRCDDEGAANKFGDGQRPTTDRGIVRRRLRGGGRQRAKRPDTPGAVEIAELGKNPEGKDKKATEKSKEGSEDRGTRN